MAVFDQRNQKVTYQYNAAGNINIGAAQDRATFANELEKLKAELSKAKQAGALNDDVATDAEYQLTKAIQQSEKPEPDKAGIVQHLTTAKQLVEGVAMAGGALTGLVTALGYAVQQVQVLF